MTKRGASLLLDAAMLSSFSVLLSWRLTGVPIHEWLAAGLLGLIVVHLIVHWHWVETRVARAVQDAPRRTRLNLLLNGSLFLAMGTALVSGFIISKVIVPNTLTPGAYLKWHHLHDASSSWALCILGLHVALNWDLITAGLRRLTRGERAAFAAAPPVRSTAVARSLRGLTWIALASATLVAATWEIGTVLPDETRVFIQTRDGRIEEHAPPADLTMLDSEAERPAPSHAVIPFAARLALLTAVAVAGRKLLRLRLG
jgi:hypothetical protein